MTTEAGKLLTKAGRAIRAAQVLAREGEYGFSLGRAYYAMFYAAEALLSDRGLRYRKHAGVSSAFGEHLVKTGEVDPKYHRWLLDGFDQRVQGDYGFDFEPGEQDAEELISKAIEFLREAERLLAGQR